MPLLFFTDQLCLPLTTSGHAKPPLRVQPEKKKKKSSAWTHHHGCEESREKAGSSPFWKYLPFQQGLFYVGITSHPQQCRNYLMFRYKLNIFSLPSSTPQKNSTSRIVLITCSVCESPNTRFPNISHKKHHG